MKRLIAVVAVVLVLLLIFQPGSFLVFNDPQKSDAIVVLAGDHNDVRYNHGMELLRAGYGQHLVLDVGYGRIFGQSAMDLAANFVKESAGADASRVSICAIDHDSTNEEAPQIGECLARLQPPPHSVVVVTDEYHTRRALSILRKRVPQYEWSAGAAVDPGLFGTPWWKQREWAKTYLYEVEKLLWWELWERWRN